MPVFSCDKYAVWVELQQHPSHQLYAYCIVLVDEQSKKIQSIKCVFEGMAIVQYVDFQTY